MRNVCTFLLLFFCSKLAFSQYETQLDSVNPILESSTSTIKKDTTNYTKSIDFYKKRTFKDELNKKYSGKDFTYKEDKRVEKKKKQSSSTSKAFVDAILFFFSKIFPFLLGAFIIVIILKTFLDGDIGFWNFGKKVKRSAEKLVYEDEDIHEIDINALLQKAIEDKDYRLAVRYYYLSVLKELSVKKLIDYHKDKTNLEYQFELKDADIRKKFSYLTYIYSYVWYGKFTIDQDKYTIVQPKFTSFLSSI